MGRITNRSYLACPLMEEFHIRNVIGCCERKQFMFGGRSTITDLATCSKAITFASLTGSLITSVDHSQILIQTLNSAPINKTYVDNKTSKGFTIYGDALCEFSIIVLATLPVHPVSQPKWAKDYCPYCKNLDFKGIVGSTLRDIVAFTMTGATTGQSGSLAVKFGTLTKQTGVTHGMITEYYTTGTLRDPLVTMMENDDYQIAIFKTTEAGGVVTVPPYPSAIKKDGFTLNGDAAQHYDMLIFGQIGF